VCVGCGGHLHTERRGRSLCEPGYRHLDVETLRELIPRRMYEVTGGGGGGGERGEDDAHAHYDGSSADSAERHCTGGHSKHGRERSDEGGGVKVGGLGA
jgi:hypothetical protein